VIRAIVGIALIVAPMFNFLQLSIWANSWFAYGAMVVGAILVLTAAFSFCPIYRLFGKTDIRA